MRAGTGDPSTQARFRLHAGERRTMDTLTRIRAFIDVVDAEGFRPRPGASANPRRCCRNMCANRGRARRAAVEPHDAPVLADRGRPHLLSQRIGNPEGDRQPRDLVPCQQFRPQGPIANTVPRTFVDADIGQSLIDFGKEHPELSRHRLGRPVHRPRRGGFDVAIESPARGSDADRPQARRLPGAVCACRISCQGRRPRASERTVQAAVHPDTNGRSYSSWRFVEKTVRHSPCRSAGRSRSTVHLPRRAPR